MDKLVIGEHRKQCCLFAFFYGVCAQPVYYQVTY